MSIEWVTKSDEQMKTSTSRSSQHEVEKSNTLVICLYDWIWLRTGVKKKVGKKDRGQRGSVRIPKGEVTSEKASK